MTAKIPKINKLYKKTHSFFSEKTNLPLATNYKFRLTILGAILLCGIGLVLLRYSYLALLPSDLRQKLKNQATKQFETEITLTPPRAEITDRNGHPLAISVIRPSLFIVPNRIPADKKIRNNVVKQLGISATQLDDLSKKNKSFAWLKRKIDPKEIDRIGDLSSFRNFIGMVEESKRIYPEKELAAHLIGFVGIDNNGLAGAEKTYNSTLNSEVIIAKVMRDARGRLTLITPNGAVKPEPPNDPLKLSIDFTIQSFTEEYLQAGVEKAKARGGSAIVMDIDTGELLSIASYPTFDLNAPPSDESDKRRFRAIMDALELGSVVKPIFISQVLEKNIVKTTDTFFCENGSYPVPGGKIRDDHPHGLISLSEVIKFSSNICTYKIMQKLGRKGFQNMIYNIGFARQPGTGLAGEWGGSISEPETWREMRFANMAFGQGLAISALQLTNALATVTGGGTHKGVRIIAVNKEQIQDPEGPLQRYISPSTSNTITQMMKTVVEEEGGTGRLAQIKGVEVAGKTGTAQKISPITKKYSERIASFIGVFPADNPKYAITVVIDEPQVRPAYGGTLAGPVFANIGTQTIRYLNSIGKLPFALADEEEVKATNKLSLKTDSSHH